MKRFWILDTSTLLSTGFRFWIRGHEKWDFYGRVSQLSQSKIKNPKSKMDLMIAVLGAAFGACSRVVKMASRVGADLGDGEEGRGDFVLRQPGVRKSFRAVSEKVSGDQSQFGDQSARQRAWPAVMSERRAGKIYGRSVHQRRGHADPRYISKPIFSSRSGRQLILPEVIDESKWWEGKHHYADPEGKYVFVFQGNVHGGENAYNTKLVNPKEFKSYWDFLDPKWKGKIVVYDVSRVSTVAHSLRFLFNHPDLGSEFVAILQRDGFDLFPRRTANDRLARRGKISSGVLCQRCRRRGEARSAGEVFRSGPIQRRRIRRPVPGRRESVQERAPSQRRQGCDQLAPVARGTETPIRKSLRSCMTCANRCAKIFPRT